jgi:hypothetical protein
LFAGSSGPECVPPCSEELRPSGSPLRRCGAFLEAQTHSEGRCASAWRLACCDTTRGAARVARHCGARHAWRRSTRAVSQHGAARGGPPWLHAWRAWHEQRPCNPNRGGAVTACVAAHARRAWHQRHRLATRGASGSPTAAARRAARLADAATRSAPSQWYARRAWRDMRRSPVC